MDKEKAEKRAQTGPPAAPGQAAGSNQDVNAKIAALEAEKKALRDQNSRPHYCVDFITKGCFNDNCGMMHVEKEQVDKAKKHRKAMAAEKKKAKRAQSAGK